MFPLTVFIGENVKYKCTRKSLEITTNALTNNILSVPENKEGERIIDREIK